MALVGELATVPVKVVPLGATAVDAAKLMLEERIGDVVVVDDDGRLVGMLTDRDIALRVVAEQRDAANTAVRDICTIDPVSVRALDEVDEAQRLMREHVVHRLPVIDHDGRPSGILSLEDLAASGYVSDEDLRDVARAIGRAYRERTAIHGG
jgi:CBS domain-containing protein